MNRIAELHSLADDPAAFARRRHEVLQAYLDGIPPERRAALRALQSRLDMESAVAASPPRTVERLLAAITDRVDLLESIVQRAAAAQQAVPPAPTSS